MAWPSGTKAGTTNVDNPNDLVANARADIKQNIDNVNSIIDEFNISSPSDGDLLQYSSSSGQWEQVASTSVGSAADFATLGFTAATDFVSGNTYRKPITSEFDPNNFVDVAVDTFTFSLPAGNYILQIVVTKESEPEIDTILFNESDSTTIGTAARFLEIGNTNSGIYNGTIGFTLTATKSLSLRQTTTNSSNRNVLITGIITKF